MRDEDQDALAGGSGRDVVDAYNRPASTDAIDCGSGFDKVLVDSMDVTEDCEKWFTNVNAFYNSVPNYYFEPFERIP